ncbi:MAG TPA: GWxTD domain-containing protein [Thermoanaerobaculia bacterium]|nr:GWxTD domain-containing protein [Thermoanaerobaculia bacterium]
MAQRSSMAGRLPAALLSLLLPGLALSCQSSGPAQAPGIGGLLDGPTRWLMLPEEQRQARQLTSTRDAALFTETFWDRRDPDPATPANEYARTFYERVEAADKLYSEDGTRGSMTDKGRAFILLGSPPVLRYSQKQVPAWDPGRPGTRPSVEARGIAVESWIYQLDQLDPRLAELIRQEDGEETLEVVVTFAVEPHRTYLLEGEEYLELAILTARQDAPDH